jgi:rhodanese-related sulfurtransferase
MALHDIDPKTLMKWIEEEKVTIVDVREPWEFAHERLKNVIHIPMSSFDPKKVPAEKGKIVVFYCKGGVRSARAAGMWMALGHEDGYHLAGGLDFWKAEGGALESAKVAGISIHRQVAIIVGAMVAISTLFGIYAHPGFHIAAGLIGFGYMISGLTGICGLEILLGKCQGGSCKSGGCCKGKGSCGTEKNMDSCKDKGSCCDKEKDSCTDQEKASCKIKSSCHDKDNDKNSGGGCCGI